MGAFKVKENLYWVGAQDPDLRVFDVIMRTDFGTSYNSYLLKTENHNILFETVKLKHFDQFLNNLRDVCEPEKIDYIVVDHTEPDHAGGVEKLLEYAPNAKVMASSVALNFLSEICNREIPGIPVQDKQEIAIDQYTLQFHSVPFLHWPDSIYTYIKENQTLITCDSFGCHYSDNRIANDLIDGDFLEAYRYYFDMIMGPFKPHVQFALDRIKGLRIQTICPGHGPVLRENLDYYLGLYDQWSRQPKRSKRDKPHIVNAFVSAYGYTESLAKEISRGINDVIDADIDTYDMVYADPDQVQEAAENADAILLGSPTVNGDALPPVLDIAMKMNGVLHGGKVAGSYGSYGWSGEAPEMLMSRLRSLRMNTVEPPLRINFKPDKENLEEARKYGKRFGKRVKEEWVKLWESSDGKTYWQCTVCGEIFEGAMPPLTCPVCGAGTEAFIEHFPEDVTYSSEKPLNAVIIGSGIAAISAAISLRKRNGNARITMISSEKELPYFRPVLTNAIAEKIDDSQFYVHPENFFNDNRIALKLNSHVHKIHHNEHQVIFTNGDHCSYDKLLLATGATPFMPPIKGVGLPEVTALRDTDDLKKIHNFVDDGKKSCVIIGGGLLGLEMASSLEKRGIKVHIYEASPYILPRQTDQQGATLLKRLLNESGITLDSGVFVDEIIGADHVSGVRTQNGQNIACDFVIISAGIQSNISLARDAGLKVDRSIIVDQYMTTSHPDIYAAGDCASYNGLSFGIWEAAGKQGDVAGANMAGEKKAYLPRIHGATLNALKRNLFAIGDLGKDHDQEYQKIIKNNDFDYSYKALYFKNDTLCGGLLIGNLDATNLLIRGINSGFTFEEARDKLLC